MLASAVGKGTDLIMDLFGCDRNFLPIYEVINLAQNPYQNTFQPGRILIDSGQHKNLSISQCKGLMSPFCLNNVQLYCAATLDSGRFGIVPCKHVKRLGVLMCISFV